MGRTKTSNYTDQRLRLGYTAKASDDLKLVTQFEVNTRWGNTNTTGVNTAGVGGGVDTDGITSATCWAYLDFNMGKSVNVKAGLQPMKDKLKGLYFDADLPAAQVAYKTGGYTLNLLYSRFNDSTTTAGAVPANLGDMTADLFVWKIPMPLAKTPACHWFTTSTQITPNTKTRRILVFPSKRRSIPLA